MPIRISSLLSRNRKTKMDENLKQEALLRHLLSKRKNTTDDDFLYSFLLGYRLFLSPHELLTQLQALLTEDISRNMQSPSEGTLCSKCHQLHSRAAASSSHSESEDVVVKSSPTESSTVVSASETSTMPNKNEDRSQTFVSSTFIQINAPTITTPDNDVVDGEDSICRRRRGRKRNQVDESDHAEANTSNDGTTLETDRLNAVSCDSGILSGVIDMDELDRKNKSSVVVKISKDKNGNNSGYLVENDTSGNCTQCHNKLEGQINPDFKQQLIHVLHKWVHHFPADFRNKKIMWTLNDVINGCQNENEELSGLCTEVVDCISRRTAAQEAYEQKLRDFDHEDSSQASQKRCKKDGMVNFVLKLKDATDVNEMAQQLCLVEMDFLKHVGAEEFLQLFTAVGEEDVTTSLGACVRWFNRLSHLVATIICMCRKRKHGRHVITFFARVANRCFELSNFNSSMAILTGLSLGPVTRLNKTWNKLVLTELHKLQNIFDPSNNFLTYRSIYMSRVENLRSSAEKKTGDDVANRYSIISHRSVASATSTASQQGDSGIECDHETPTPGCTKPACCGGEGALKTRFTFDSQDVPREGTFVPFLVLLVKDVYFLNHAIQTVDESGNINFEKLQNLSNILKSIEDWKQMTPSYQKHSEMHEFLVHSPVEDDEDLYLLSYKREAPTNRFEKQQLKTLRAERDLKKRNEAAAAKSLRRKTV